MLLIRQSYCHKKTPPISSKRAS